MSKAPLRRVAASEYVGAIHPYRKETLECGHVIDRAHWKEAEKRRCHECTTGPVCALCQRAIQPGEKFQFIAFLAIHEVCIL